MFDENREIWTKDLQRIAEAVLRERGKLIDSRPETDVAIRNLAAGAVSTAHHAGVHTFRSLAENAHMLPQWAPDGDQQEVLKRAAVKLSSSLELMVIVQCEECGINERVWFSGIVTETPPGEIRELLDTLFHGVRALHFVELDPIQGVKAPNCIGKILTFFSVETCLLHDPFRNDPYRSWN